MLSALPSARIVSSEWLWMSMKPGATTSPVASMIFAALRLFRSPTAAIRPPRIPTSAMRQGLPVPSTNLPAANQNIEILGQRRSYEHHREGETLHNPLFYFAISRT